MRTRDLVLGGLSSLRRQKLRTALTGLGVAIGIAALVSSLSVGLGVRKIIDDSLRNEKRLREIVVYAGGGEAGDEIAGVPEEEVRVDEPMSDARRDRIRRRLARDWRRDNVRPASRPLTPAQVDEFATWDHVAKVEPDLSEGCRVALRGQTASGQCVGFAGDPASLSAAIDFGRPPTAGTDEAIVHEYLLYRCGVRSDADLQAILGERIRVVMTTRVSARPEVLLALFDADASKLGEEEMRAIEKVREQLPNAIESMDLTADEREAVARAIGRRKPKVDGTTATAEFTIVGVFRDANPKREGDLKELLDAGLRGDVAVPRDRAEPFFATLPHRRDRGYDRVVITVDSDDNLKEVCDRLEAGKRNYYAVGLYLRTAKKNALLIGFAMDFVALIALAVACLGITNTMFTAVLERVKEIGIMKAVGAKDRHILTMFLVEGAIIGLVGGGLGLLAAWLGSFPGDDYALRLIRDQDPNMPQPTTVFRFPVWLLLGAPAFAVALTTLAGLLPARRAARIEPVAALRAE